MKMTESQLRILEQLKRHSQEVLNRSRATEAEYKKAIRWRLDHIGGMLEVLKLLPDQEALVYHLRRHCFQLMDELDGY